MSPGPGRFDSSGIAALEEEAVQLARLWKEERKEEMPRERFDEFSERQAWLIWAYNGTPGNDRKGRDREYFLGQRYLAFLSTSDLLTTECPVRRKPDDPRFRDAARLTVEDCKQFAAHLNYRERTRAARNTEGEQSADYLVACDWVRTAWPCRESSTHDCLDRIRAVLRTTLPIDGDRKAVIEEKLRTAGGACRADVEEYVHALYGWLTSPEPRDPSEEESRTILQSFRRGHAYVSPAELLMRCWLASRFPHLA